MGMIDVSLEGIGSLAKDIREAFTGEAVIDPNKRMELQLKLQELEQASILAQIKVNEVEAAHPSIFVAGWRPALGWVAAVSLALMYIPRAIVMTYMWSLQCLSNLEQGLTVVPNFPDLGAMDIIGLVGSLLGIAALRSFDKSQGTETKKVSKK